MGWDAGGGGGVSALPACDTKPLCGWASPCANWGQICDSSKETIVDMPPESTLWKLDPHTLGKHLVLRSYLDAWLPKITRWNRRVLVIDAFAGPGEYIGGENGSPVIAIDALVSHKAAIGNEVRYLFIEKETDRFEHLVQVLRAWDASLPKNCIYQVRNTQFDETLSEALDLLEQQKQHLAPAFVMIDPFGVSGTPMSIIRRILDNPSSEVYVSFMYEAISRHMSHENFEPHLDELFGCTEWRQAITMPDSAEKRDFLFDLYAKQLKANGAQYVLHFELFERGRLVYAIFFGTKHLEGCDTMKQAIWKVAPTGDFRFRSNRIAQPILGEEMIDWSLFRRALSDQFTGKGWQPINVVEDFAKSDLVSFHSGQLRKYALIPMEDAGEIEIREGTRKKRRSFPAGTLLRFL